MKKETILILEIDQNVTWTLKTLLENEGYPVVVANSIERALGNFSNLMISGVITEYRIENVSTLEAIRKLKETFPGTYVMMITNNETKMDEYEEIIEAGVDDYFLKPISIKKILLHLRKGLKYHSFFVEKSRLESEITRLHS
ncbi:MAG: response regulator, partial [bacterium]